jgi:hypothetical protein
VGLSSCQHKTLNAQFRQEVCTGSATNDRNAHRRQTYRVNSSVAFFKVTAVCAGSTRKADCLKKSKKNIKTNPVCVVNEDRVV